MTKRDYPGWVYPICIILIIPAAIWWAYVLTVLWGWFIVPLGVIQIGKAHAYGLIILAGLFRSVSSYVQGKDSDIVHVTVYSYLVPIIAFGLAALAASLM